MLQTTESFTNTQANTPTNTKEQTQNGLISYDKSEFEEHLKQTCHEFYDMFELDEYIDSGYKSVVYKGKHINQENKKKYFFMFGESKNVYNYNHKMKLIKKLHHENISEILAFYKINPRVYCSIYEYGKYGNLNTLLQNFLKRKKLPETFVNYLAKPILEALNYMHKLKFIHMNIKEGNIVIDSLLNPKLIDLFSAFSFENYGPNDLVKLPIIGAGSYIPYEILTKKEIEIKYGDKIDIYSLGVTLFNLIFGFYPYGLNNIEENNYEQIKEYLKNAILEFPNAYRLSEKGKHFLKKVLEKDYKERYNIKEALEDPWIKGWDIINEEKENIEIIEKFIIELISDNIYEFNSYIN